MNFLGMKAFDKAIEILSVAGALEHVAIIGSWAERLYSACNVVPGLSFMPITRDLDVLVLNMRRPSTPIPLIDIAKNSGAIVESDRMTSSTRILIDGALEMEFLIAKRGAGLESSLKTNIGVTADSLRHLDILLNNLMTVEYGGVAVNVPVPEAYTVQKLVIHGDRMAQQSGKDIKDAEAVIGLWPLLDMERLLNVKLQLTKKETRRFEEALSRFGLSLDGSVRDCNAELEHVLDIYRAALSGGRDGRTPVIDAATLRDDENDC